MKKQKGFFLVVGILFIASPKSLVKLKPNNDKKVIVKKCGETNHIFMWIYWMGVDKAEKNR